MSLKIQTVSTFFHFATARPPEAAGSSSLNYAFLPPIPRHMGDRHRVELLNSILRCGKMVTIPTGKPKGTAIKSRRQYSAGGSGKFKSNRNSDLGSDDKRLRDTFITELISKNPNDRL